MIVRKSMEVSPSDILRMVCYRTFGDRYLCPIPPAVIRRRRILRALRYLIPALFVLIVVAVLTLVVYW